MAGVIHLRASQIRWPTCVWRADGRHLTLRPGDHVWLGRRLAMVEHPGASPLLRLYGEDGELGDERVEAEIAALEPAGVATVGGLRISLGGPRG